MKKNIIQEKSFQFSLDIMKLHLQMTEKKDYIISRQLLRSATSIGANVEEAIGGQSKRDFVSKMNIALKESREANYWLRLLNESNYLGLQYESNLRESLELVRILSAIVKSSKEDLAA